MACVHAIDRFVTLNSLPVNVVINMLLILICFASYVALFAFYFIQGMNINPFIFIHARPYTLPPTAVIPLIGVTLTSAPSALLRRADEVLAFSNTVGGRCGEGLSGESLGLGKVGRERYAVWLDESG